MPPSLKPLRPSTAKHMPPSLDFARCLKQDQPPATKEPSLAKSTILTGKHEAMKKQEQTNQEGS
jgi:hypothetical protein